MAKAKRKNVVKTDVEGVKPVEEIKTDATPTEPEKVEETTDSDDGDVNPTDPTNSDDGDVNPTDPTDSDDGDDGSTVTEPTDSGDGDDDPTVKEPTDSGDGDDDPTDPTDSGDGDGDPTVKEPNILETLSFKSLDDRLHIDTLVVGGARLVHSIDTVRRVIGMMVNVKVIKKVVFGQSYLYEDFIKLLESDYEFEYEIDGRLIPFAKGERELVTKRLKAYYKATKLKK